jgi:FKBP-type peptidyl-prolyl cis-trans isomerase SlyD
MTVTSQLRDGDVVRVTYTARVGESGRVIETTDPDVASDATIEDIEATGPTPVVLGEGHVFEPVEAAIRDSTIGESIRVTVDPEDAFGEGDPTDYTHVDIDTVPGDRREPGAELTHSGRSGFVESLDEGSARINFNHPLAGMAIEYELTVRERIETPLESVHAVLELYGLASEVEVSFGSPGPEQLRITVPDPTNDTWQRGKRRAVSDLQDLPPIESVAVVETYGDTT